MIKPCPFCGGKPQLRAGPFTYVQCTQCRATGPQGKVAGEQDEINAAMGWQNRHGFGPKVERTIAGIKRDVDGLSMGQAYWRRHCSRLLQILKEAGLAS